LARLVAEFGPLVPDPAGMGVVALENIGDIGA